MVPAGITGAVVDDVAAHLSAGDVIIDGGNSTTSTTSRAPNALAPPRIDYVDCGTSGGVFGLERGFCLMIGGPDAVVAGSTRSSARSRPGSATQRTHAGTHR